MKEVKILLVGTGGYGATYTDRFAKNPPEGARIVGTVDPFNPADYKTIEEFYKTNTADLAVISTPIQFHADQMIYCMEHGSDVLCEKPVCGNIADVPRVIAVRDALNKNVSIGYQWSHSETIQALKADIKSGRYGKALRLKTMVLSPRNHAYFKRSTGWAGKRFSSDGKPIYDSVLQNANAHYLHNMLFVSGAKVKGVSGMVARANPIEMFDTCAIHVATDGPDIYYYTSHAIEKSRACEPLTLYEFERGIVYTDRTKGGAWGTDYFGMIDGEIIEYGNSQREQTRKLDIAIAAVRGEGEVLCSLEDASEHEKVVNALAALYPVTPVFEKTALDDDVTYVEGLADRLLDAYYNYKEEF